MYVCLCKGVTDHEIRDLLTSPFINDADDVGAACGAGTCCGTCQDEIRQLCEASRTERRDAKIAASVTNDAMIAVAVNINSGVRAS